MKCNRCKAKYTNPSTSGSGVCPGCAVSNTPVEGLTFGGKGVARIMNMTKLQGTSKAGGNRYVVYTHY